MRDRTVRIITLWTLALALPLSICSGQNGRGDPIDQITSLRAAVLADPYDADQVAALAELREAHDQQRLRSLAALAEGLDAYLAGRYDQAAEHLRAAMRSPQTVELADHVSLVALADLAAQCEGQARPDVCDRCGGTGSADCHACSASGQQRCPECKGRGEIRQRIAVQGKRKTRYLPSNREKTCPTCQGVGVVTCQICGGQGLLGCDQCQGALGQPLGTPILGDYTRESIQKTIAIARHLADGGLDLYSPSALEVSPKLQ